MFGKRSVLLVAGGLFLGFLTACTDPVDVTPDPFTFAAVPGVQPGALVTSETVTITGINTEASASVSSGGELLVNGVASGATASLSNGDQLAVRVTASPEFDTSVTATVTIGDFQADFVVTTSAAPVDVTPDPFTFAAVPGVQPGALVTSETVTITGINTEASASVSSGGELLVNGVASGATASLSNGDQLAVRVTASPEFDTSVTATVTIGDFQADFVVTTSAANAPVVSISANLVTAAPGDTVTLSWTIDNGDVDSLELELVQSGRVVDVSGSDSYDVVVTDEYPDLEFVLTASHSSHALEGQDTVSVEVPLWVCRSPSDVITIADPALLGKFYGLVGTPDEGPITCGDALAVTTWDTLDGFMGHGEIESLVGLQHFANLVAFIGPYNLVSDVSPVAGLSNLEQLNLDKNRVLDLSPLVGMPSLRILELWDNGPVLDSNTDGITDIGPLASIPTLEELYLSENRISDLGPLADLPNLRVLYAIANDITDISPLAELTNLQVLRLSVNRIADGSALANLENLAWLELEYNLFQDAMLPPLGVFEHLWAVKLEGNYLTDLSPLIDNDAFPAGVGAPGMPPHRQQPTAPLIHFGYNCLSEADDLAAEAAFVAKGLDIDQSRVSQDPAACSAVIDGASLGAFQRQQEAIQMFRDEGRIR